jgi:hypothetical protein
MKNVNNIEEKYDGDGGVCAIWIFKKRLFRIMTERNRLRADELRLGRQFRPENDRSKRGKR